MRGWGVDGVSTFGRDMAGDVDPDLPGAFEDLVGCPAAWPEGLTKDDLASLVELGIQCLEDLAEDPQDANGLVSFVAYEALIAGRDAPRQASILELVYSPAFLLGLLVLVRLRRVRFGALEIEFSSEGAKDLMRTVLGLSQSQSSNLDTLVRRAIEREEAIRGGDDPEITDGTGPK